jgi:hypothetical protein
MIMTIVSGRLYYGRTFGYNGKDANGDEVERTAFAGRVQFRDPVMRDKDGKAIYHYIDVVCFKDQGKNGGLVGFLEEYFTTDPDDKTDFHPIEIRGYLRNTQKQLRDVKVNFKVQGKTVPKTIPRIDYTGIELVIESADFPPDRGTNGKTRSSQEAVDLDDDELDADAFADADCELATDNDEEEFDEEAEEIAEEKPKRRKSTTSTKAKTASSKTSTKRKQKQKEESDDEGDDAGFFED